MAVQFELYKTPMPKEKKNKTRYHARPVSFETVNTEKLAYRIHDRSTLRVSDIISTLEELKNMLTYYESGTTVTMTVMRLENGQYTEKQVDIVLGSKPEEETESKPEAQPQSQRGFWR